MARAILGELPDRLETLVTELSEALVGRHGDDAVRALVEGGVSVPELPAWLATLNAPADMAFDQFLTLALYHDGLTLVALACVRAQELCWDHLEEVRPILTRFASFYGSVTPRYQSFRTLPRERLADFWNAYCGDAKWFGLLCSATHFQGVRLCAYRDAALATPESLPGFLNGVLGPLWQVASKCVGIAGSEASTIWSDLEEGAARWLQRWKQR